MSNRQDRWEVCPLEVHVTAASEIRPHLLVQVRPFVFPAQFTYDWTQQVQKVLLKAQL